MTKAYGRSDTGSVTIPQPNGEQHVHEPKLVQRANGGQAAEVDCDYCAAHLLKTDLFIEGKVSGWALNPDAAPVTEVEVAQKEAQQQNTIAAMLEDPQGYMEFVNNKRPRRPAISLDIPTRS